MSADEGRQTFTTSEGREVPRPRKKRNARVPDRYQQLIDGVLPIEDLDEEELFRGQLRNADGHIRGNHPKAIPWVMHNAYVEQVGKTLERTIITSMPDIVDQLIRIATGEVGGDTGIAMDVQAKAAMYLTDRILGRPTERRELDVKVHARWEQALDGGSLLVDIPDPDETDIIDAELVPTQEPAQLSQQTQLLVERPSHNAVDRAPDEVGAKDPKPKPQPRPRTGVKLGR